jgi:phosphohistidine phosphatase SixA
MIVQKLTKNLWQKKKEINMRFINRLLMFVVAIIMVIVVQGCTTIPTHSKAGTTTTIILTRHGDRNSLGQELNDKGRKRAEALVKAVAGINISAIYCPNISRNIETARPLAEHIGLKINIVDSAPDVNELIRTFLTKYAGQTILWVGNTSNLDNIYSMLGGEGDGPVHYGELFVMTIKDKGAPDIIKKRYGAM